MTRTNNPKVWAAKFEATIRPKLGGAARAFHTACLAGGEQGAIAAADQVDAAAAHAAGWLARNPCPIPGAKRHVEAAVRCLRVVGQLAPGLPTAADPETASAAVLKAWEESRAHFEAFARVLIKCRAVGPDFRAA